MQLIELVNAIRNNRELDKIIKSNKTLAESACLLIYMNNELNEHSLLSIFSIEETEGDINYSKDGVNYIELISLDSAVDFVNELKGKISSDLLIAKMLFEYGVYDA